MQTKLVSVVLPVYNGEKYLRESINSILNQTYKNIELIIVNDNSTDSTLEIAKEYATKDDRVKVFSNEINLKLPSSLNVGFSHAKGEYLSWTSDDNFYHDNAIEKMVYYLEEHHNDVMVCSDFMKLYVDNNKIEEVKLEVSAQNMINGNCVGACFLYRKSIADLVGQYAVDKFLVEDYDYWLRIMLEGNIGHIPEFLYTYRLHSKSLTGTRMNEILQKTLQVQKEYFPLYKKKFKKIKKYSIENKSNVFKRLFSIEKINNRRVINFFGFKISYKYICKNQKKVIKFVSSQIKTIKKYNKRILVVIPSEPIEAYEKKGRGDLLKNYYNPKGYFDLVFALSPYEKGIVQKHGMTIIETDAYLYKKLLKTISPCAVRAYGGYWATTFATKNRVKGIPVISSVHDTNPKLLHQEILLSDKVICMSNAVAKLCIDNGVNPEKVVILPNRVDEKIFNPKVDSKHLKELYSGNFKYVLCVGRLTKQKNIDTMLKALSLLPDEYKCIFVGNQSESEFLLLARELGVENKCIWIEKIENAELAYYYSFAKCMCTPSRWEGFGIVFIEAAACAAPVITSNIAPMNEYFKHNENAYLIDDYENPVEIAHAVEFVCNDDNYAKKIAQGAQEMAKKFYMNEIDGKEIEIYKNYLEV